MTILIQINYQMGLFRYLPGEPLGSTSIVMSKISNKRTAKPRDQSRNREDCSLCKSFCAPGKLHGLSWLLPKTVNVIKSLNMAETSCQSQFH